MTISVQPARPTALVHRPRVIGPHKVKELLLYETLVTFISNIAIITVSSLLLLPAIYHY